MPTEANMMTTGTLAADTVAVWLEDELLDRGERDLAFYAVCDKTTIPNRNGRVVQFTRYERLPLPFRPLEEGVTPVLTPLTISTVQAVLDQWGAVTGTTDQAELTVKHPTIQLARDLLSDQHNETIDREVQVVLLGASAVYYAGNKASRALLTAADVIRSDDIRRIVATLRSNGAKPYDSRGYKGIVDPWVEADLNKDPTFVNAGTYSQVATLKDFDLGKWMGVWWMRSNHMPVFSQMAGADVTVAAVTGGAIPAGGTGFTAGGSVRTKVTRLNTQTRFEEVIDNEVTTTDAGAFGVAVTIASTAATGVYFVYSSLVGGAAGTPTRQVTVNHTTGTASVITTVMSGAVTAPAYVATATGPIAPPDGPTVNVHTSYVFGKGGVGCVGLGEGLTTHFVPRKASDSDPLAQRTKVGWKRMWKAVVLNNDFFRRLESASEFN